MSFLSLLRNDARVFWRCINRQIVTRNEPVEVSTCCNSRIICRTFSEEGKQIPKPPSDKIIAYLKVKDRIPNDFELIYRVRDTFGFTVCHGLVVLTGFVIPPFFLLIAHKHGYELPIYLMEGVSINNLTEICFYTGFVYCLFSLTLLLVKRFPMRIYRKRNSDDYFACFSDLLFPWKTQLVKFKKGEVRRILDSEMKPFQLSNYTINGSKVIFTEDHFYRPVDLEQMVGSFTDSEQEKKEFE